MLGRTIRVLSIGNQDGIFVREIVEPNRTGHTRTRLEKSNAHFCGQNGQKHCKHKRVVAFLACCYFRRFHCGMICDDVWAIV